MVTLRRIWDGGRKEVSSENIEILLAGISTLAIYSFLYRENSVYRAFEHIFIGIATAWGLVSVVKDVLWQRFFKTMFGFNTLSLPDGTVVVPYEDSSLYYLIPTIFGLLYYTLYFEKYRKLAQLVISFQLGCAGGLAFKGFFVEFLPQLYDSARPIDSYSNAFFMITLLSSCSYFFFTFKVSDYFAVQKISSLGRYLMMSCFGAFFGSTIMARMSLLVDRIEFLTTKWIPVIQGLL